MRRSISLGCFRTSPTDLTFKHKAQFMRHCLALLLICTIASTAQTSREKSIPANFVEEYYKAYSGVPTASRLSIFYADEAIIDDPTYDFVGKDKASIFKNFDKANLANDYDWQVDQVITEGNKLVTEGLLKAKFNGIPYEMRFTNIFHFKNGKIVKQYDYYDNKDWYKVGDEWKAKQFASPYPAL